MVRHWMWQRVNFVAGISLLLFSFFDRSMGLSYPPLDSLRTWTLFFGLLLLIDHYRIEMNVVIADYYIDNPTLFRFFSFVSYLGFWIMAMGAFFSLFCVLAYVFFSRLQ